MFNAVYGNKRRYCENRAKQASAEFNDVVAAGTYSYHQDSNA